MSAAETSGSPFRQPKAVWAVAFACVISFMGIGLVDPILPALAEQLSASPSQVSLLFTSYLVITAVMMLVTGWVSSRIGAKPTLLAGLVIIVLFAAAAGASGSIGEIVGFRAGWGLGNALFIATSLAVIVASASGGFAGAIILYETALGVGIALGPLVGGLLGAVSWRLPFFGVAVLMAVALIATLVLLDRTPKPAQKIAFWAPIRALRHRSLATISVAALAYNWGFFTLLAYSPYSMHLEALGLGAVFTGWGLMVAIFAVAVAPALERRFGTVRVLYVNLALMAADLAVIAVGQDSPVVVIVAVIVAGAFIGLNNTLVTQAVMSVAPVERPVASASYSFVRFLGGGLAPWIAGLIAEAFLPSTPFYVAAVVVLLGIVVLATAHRLLRAVERGEPVAESASGTNGALVASDASNVPFVRGDDAQTGASPSANGADRRPVLVAVDDVTHAGTVVAAGARLARLLDAPAVLVHVPETVQIGDAQADRPEPANALGARLAELRAAGVEAIGETLTATAGHAGVGPAIVGSARGHDARAVVVGSPHGGSPLYGTADRALWSEGACPVVVIPPGWSGPSGGRVAPAANAPGAGAPGEEVPARDAAAVSVSGHVRDADGRPAAAVLTLMDTHGHQVARAETDADGAYRLVAAAVDGPGTGLLLARGRGTAPTVAPVPLAAGVRHDVTLECSTLVAR